MKIVLDLAWGAAVGLAPAVFTEMGAEVICLHNEADGDRINVNCGSTHLDILQAAVQEHQADMGFAFDGDADRVLAVDNTGRPLMVITFFTFGVAIYNKSNNFQIT